MAVLPTAGGLPVPPTSRVQVKIDYFDAPAEVIESVGNLSLQAGFLVIPLPKEAVLGIALPLIRRWEAVPSPLAVVRTAGGPAN